MSRVVTHGYVYGYLYAVKMLIPDYPFQPIKVGFSTKPLKRKGAYGSGPFPCEWLGIWRGTEQDELDFHIQFHARQLAGEWFEPTDEMMRVIAEKIEAHGKAQVKQLPTWYRSPEYQAEQRTKAAAVLDAILQRA